MVWSGTVADGLTSVHVGRLVSDSATERLTWAVLIRVGAGENTIVEAPDAMTIPMPKYLDQPEPTLDLSPRTSPKSDEA